MKLGVNKISLPQSLPRFENVLYICCVGYGIYLKSGVNKDGKSPLYYLVKSGNKQLKRGLKIKIRPSDWDSNRFSIHAKAENALIYNERIESTLTQLRKAWSLYESETYTWDELTAYLSGGKTELDVWGFCETIIKPVESENVYKGIKDAYGAVRKIIGRELEFKDLTEGTVDICVKHWKENLRSASLKTYKYHFGKIINQAYEKKLTPYKYEPKQKWRKKKDKINRKSGRAFITTATPEQFKEAIDKAKDLWDIEALGFYLLMFGMRGLYPTDLCNIHKYEWEIQLDPPQSKLFHQRNKTNEPMDIVYSYPFDELTRRLRGYLEITHGYQINSKTGKPFLRSKEYNLSEDINNEGWFFKKYVKDTWGTFTRKLGEVGMPEMKTARKTFDTIASTLPISQAVWYHLTGHELEGIKSAYSSKDWKEISQQVDDAHEEVLAKFYVDKLYPQLIAKADKILEEKGINVKVFNYTNSCEGV